MYKNHLQEFMKGLPLQFLCLNLLMAYNQIIQSLGQLYGFLELVILPNPYFPLKKVVE